MIKIFENRIEVTEFIDEKTSKKTYYAIDSEIGEQLIKEHNLEIDTEMQEV